jgi:hypothetical protein
MIFASIRGALACAALACMTASSAVHAATTKPAPDPITEASEEAFWSGDFPVLEQQNARLRKPGSFTPDGRLELRAFRRGLDRVYNNSADNIEAYLSNVDQLTLEWATAHPDAPLAHIMHARALMRHGWSYRGGQYAHKVPEQAMRDFVAYEKRAVAYLGQHADVAFRDSYAHVTLLDIGKAIGFEDKQMAAIAREGLARNPEDTDIHYAMALSLLPKWGGDKRALDTYIVQATEQTRTLFGTGMYALLYSAAADEQYEHALFQDSHADWGKVKQGYEDLLVRYPSSNGKRNRYAWMACMAKDRPTLMRLLGEIGTQIDLEAWGENPERGLEACRRWATQL